MAELRKDARAVLDYWFGETDADGWPMEDRERLWFGADKADDDDMRRQFGDLIEQAVGGELNHWRDAPPSSMALILLTDQMSRATRRGRAAAFSGDAIALAACEQGLARGYDKKLPSGYLQFYYLPLEHSENINAQKRCVALYKRLQRDHPEKPLAEAVRYAVLHHDIIARFGRFPHRNAALERVSTEEEQAYLQANGTQTFGQRPNATDAR